MIPLTPLRELDRVVYRKDIEPLAVFPDGSQLLASTRYSGEGSFSCELYITSLSAASEYTLRPVSDQLQATTCLGAQELAYDYAQRLYPQAASRMKRPPYLIWTGPNLSSRPASSPARARSGARSQSQR